MYLTAPLKLTASPHPTTPHSPVLATTNSLPIKSADVKSFLKTLLLGVQFCHDRGVLHRDLKPDNLLFTSDKIMKLGDFGLARVQADPGQPMSTEPITLWYKPAEMLLGECYYTTKADMWSVGCIFAECMLRKPFLPGGPGDYSQLEKIFQAFGPPTEVSSSIKSNRIVMHSSLIPPITITNNLLLVASLLALIAGKLAKPHPSPPMRSWP